jgi:hypothetical protein
LVTVRCTFGRGSFGSTSLLAFQVPRGFRASSLLDLFHLPCPCPLLYDWVFPMAEELPIDVLIDLSQNLGRNHVNLRGGIQCVVPAAKSILMGSKHWFLRPEAFRSQGFDIPTVAVDLKYTHRQCMNLIGDAFNSCSYGSGIVAQWSLAGKLLRRCQPSTESTRTKILWPKITWRPHAWTNELQDLDS